ncbi:Acyl-CoA dehydrogenase family member [Saliniradius amylolyticus]|uniref:Acyl-CoA dehydrogenase family member n=1 Tax=Saliniradius amylolyticus TaxID=2183582 RepID=A0A2S2E405_9ALTE|nr:phosphotransferase family protein [Saliniradius amylolyticus]AWL12381.1 Acyl-CoA dehydrogenase family member [Saliniradius amylolyticus]
MTQKVIDTPSKVRQGEELNLESLVPWLDANIDGLSGQPEVKQYSGGASNWTYCLSYPEKDVILRRAPAGTKAKGAHDMGREYRLQKALKPVYDYVPEMLGHCEDESVIGSEFYVMQRCVGVIPRRNLPRDLNLDKRQIRTLCTNVLDAMIELHQVDYQAADLSHIAKGEGYTQRQIHGWNKRYMNAKTWNVSGAQYVRDWLVDNVPDKEHICLTHNDFRFDNVVLNPDEPTQVDAILDWELATLGDPLMDLGNTLAYWVEADDDFLAQSTRRQPTHLPGMLTRRQVVDYYLDKTNAEVEDFTFYEVYGLFRLAAIAQQIYYRYHHKQTRNPAFKHFWLFVNYLIWRCHRRIKRGR